jgi:hypothetical protein
MGYTERRVMDTNNTPDGKNGGLRERHRGIAVRLKAEMQRLDEYHRLAAALLAKKIIIA